MSRRRIAILGSTGSIGKQALDVLARHPDRFEVVALTAHSKHQELFEQAKRFQPVFVAITSEEVDIPGDLRHLAWAFGPQALEMAATLSEADDVLVAVVGMLGLGSVLAARKAGKRVLLANKEALVAGGQLVMDLCPWDLENPGLIPVDSEHSAIFQCLMGERGSPYDSLILTASGGPFRTWPKEQIDKAGLVDALKHPNWSMGQKISIDSASMFNKALEVIEAKWLFHAEPDQIQVLVHPESIVHSMVTFEDGAVLAQLGMPDMRAPISFAMAYPERVSSGTQKLRLDELGTLHFERPDLLRFPALRLAYEALKAGGAAGCMLNAANEEAVSAFVRRQIGFGHIAAIVEETLQIIGHKPALTLDDVLAADAIARRTAQHLCQKANLEES